MNHPQVEEFKGGNPQGSFYQEAIKNSAQFREAYKKRKKLIKKEEMPWEESPQGLIKHVPNIHMDTAECALEMYIQLLLPGSRSGKHRHMAEEVFYVLEGRGYDLHWDVKFDVTDKYYWDWEKEPKKFEWEMGDFVYIPPYTMHQHFNADVKKSVRIITSTNRIVKEIGYNWLEQVENAPEYKK